ncbi:FkbM family methyltransferase [Shimia sp. W99]
MKSRLVGTWAGDVLLRFSGWRSLKSVPLGNPEAAGARANAVLADRLIAQLCPAEGRFLDIGAHIGSVFASVHRATPGAEIIAIEADPDKAAALRARFPYCTLIEAAVGESEGSVDFFRDPGKSGFNSLAPGEGRERITVELRRLDDLLPDTKVDLVKIDVEGAELGALRGGARLIARGRPVILFESTEVGPNALGYSAEMLWQWFDSHDYGVFTPDRLAHEAPPMSCEVFVDSHQYPFRTLNYFAVPMEKRVVTRDRAREILGITVNPQEP